MANCDLNTRTIAESTMGFLGYNIDGFVELISPFSPFRFSEWISNYDIKSGMVTTSKYISDHTTIYINFSEKKSSIVSFNIISINLGGLCKHP